MPPVTDAMVSVSASFPSVDSDFAKLGVLPTSHPIRSNSSHISAFMTVGIFFTGCLFVRYPMVYPASRETMITSIQMIPFENGRANILAFCEIRF